MRRLLLAVIVVVLALPLVRTQAPTTIAVNPSVTYQTMPGRGVCTVFGRIGAARAPAAPTNVRVKS